MDKSKALWAMKLGGKGYLDEGTEKWGSEHSVCHGHARDKTCCGRVWQSRASELIGVLTRGQARR
jgi:hypothetical protein